jgi:hypothetical protein
VDRYRRTSVGSVNRVALDAEPRPHQVGEPLASALSRSTRIGALDDPPEQVFGAVSDALVDHAGRVLVLDARTNLIRAFTPAGRYEFTLGRAGPGPGEFRAPRAFAQSGRGRMFVVDAPSRIHIFDAAAKGYEFVRTETLPFTAHDACVIEDILVLQGIGFRDSTVIHTYSLDLRPIRSFGVVYRSGDAAFDYQAGQGVIACGGGPAPILFAPASLLAEIRAFSLDGRELWLTRFDAMRPIEYRVEPGGYSVRVPEKGYHRIRSLANGLGPWVLAQITLESPATRRGDASAPVTTLVFDAGIGRGQVLSRELPLFTWAKPGAPLLATADDPFPLVRVGGPLRQMGSAR